MSDFKKGDIVQLKSGGPAMTVASSNDGTLWCQWFDQSEKLQGNSFEAEALRPYQVPTF